MTLQQLPVVKATVDVIHSGDADGATFTTTLAASDGAPTAPQQQFTFNLNVFAPDLVARAPAVPFVGVYREPSGEKVEVDIDVDPALITLTFWEPVVPAQYRVKVFG